MKEQKNNNTWKVIHYIMVSAGALADVLGVFAAIGSSVILMPQLISVFETDSIDGIYS